MKLPRRCATAAVVAVLLATLSLAAVHAQTGLTPDDPLMPDSPGITIDWVLVGNAGNDAEIDWEWFGSRPIGFGAVPYNYRMMKFEFTNSQYAAFLNAIDPDGTNPNAVYNASMGSDVRGGISFAGENTAGSKYTVRSNMGDKPVNYVSWFNAARVSNWLHNGSRYYSNTDDTADAPQNTGAYTLGTRTFGDALARNPSAQFYVPTENEWYKAAYHTGSGGYNLYPNGFDGQKVLSEPGVVDYVNLPTGVTADSTGNGSAGGTGNFANCHFGADWNGENGNVTTVGTNGGASFYGAFDMGGNVWEWNDPTPPLPEWGSRGLRGGSFRTLPEVTSSSAKFALISLDAGVDEYDDVGFRLASPGPPVFHFNSPTPRRWFDPPLVSEYELRLSGGSASFREVGIPSTFGTADIFEFSGGSWIDIGDVSATSHFVFTNPGTTLFRIGNINPLADAGDPTGFPVFLDFYGDTTGATFGMNGVVAVPEPSTWVMVAGGLACASWSASRRRKAAA